MVSGLAKELAPYKVAVIGLTPGFVASEHIAAEPGEFGFDASKALPVENPGRVCAMLATAGDPMYISGDTSSCAARIDPPTPTGGPE